MSDERPQPRSFLDRASALARDAGHLAGDLALHAASAVSGAINGGEVERQPIASAPLDGTPIRVHSADGETVARWDALRAVWILVTAPTSWSPIKKETE